MSNELELNSCRLGLGKESAHMLARQEVVHICAIEEHIYSQVVGI